MPVETKCRGNKAAQKVQLIKLSADEPTIFKFSAWEIDPNSILTTKFRSLTHIENTRYGQIGTDSPNRVEEAREIIYEFFPEARSGFWDKSMREVVLYG
jgi:hypothetical protein